MAKAASTPELMSAFTAHLKETKEQLVRLNKIGKKLGKPFTDHTCAALQGLIEEGRDTLTPVRPCVVLRHLDQKWLT
jgi:ferritin-like metal-binding protein YciE